MDNNTVDSSNNQPVESSDDSNNLMSCFIVGVDDKLPGAPPDVSPEEDSSESEESLMDHTMTCDYCKQNREMEIFCTCGLDAVYCSQECCDNDKEMHDKVCVGLDNPFEFCFYCKDRVNDEDLCETCDKLYVCKECKDTGKHKHDCGKVGLSEDEVEKLLSTFRMVSIEGDTLADATGDITEEHCALMCMLLLESENGVVDYTSARVFPCDEDDSPYTKYAILESMLEIQTECFRYPLIVAVNENDRRIFETKTTLL